MVNVWLEALEDDEISAVVMLDMSAALDHFCTSVSQMTFQKLSMTISPAITCSSTPIAKIVVEFAASQMTPPTPRVIKIQK